MLARLVKMLASWWGAYGRWGILTSAESQNVDKVSN